MALNKAGRAFKSNLVASALLVGTVADFSVQVLAKRDSLGVRELTAMQNPPIATDDEFMTPNV